MAHRSEGLDGIEESFVAVLEGRVSRDAADRWAAGLLADDELVWDDVSLWALDRLHGIDLPAGPDGTFLHDSEQIHGWLCELRRRRAEAARRKPPVRDQPAPGERCPDR